MKMAMSRHDLDVIRSAISEKDIMHYSWQDISDICNDQLGFDFSESWYRKGCYERCPVSDDATTADDSKSMTSQEIDYYQRLADLKKERVKVSDERVQVNAYIRRLSREDTIKEIAEKAAKIVADKKYLSETAKPTPTGSNEAILQISDWHYGLVVDNWCNKYDPGIAIERIHTLRSSVIAYIQREGISTLHIVNLSDLIAGRIHLQIRLESRMDVISQVIEVSEILAEFIHGISKYCNIRYYDCCDNHSRIEPNKKDSLQLETLSRITHWYIKNRFSDISNVEVIDNEYGDDIIAFDVCGGKFSVCAVHGDKDAPGRAIDNLSMLCKKHFDLVLTAHMHHFTADEKNETVLIGNGSLIGTDEYARGLRLSSKPSQNLIMCSNTNVVESLHRIIL